MIFNIKDAQVPLWAWCIAQGKTYNVPPWVIESEMSRYWFERINAYEEIAAQAQERAKKRNGAKR